MENFKNIYWIGGSPCSGKSSLAEMLCEEYGFDYYKCDDHLDRYVKVGVEKNSDIMIKFNNMTLDETWIDRSIQEQVDDEVEFYKEAFQIILDDIRGSDRTQGLIIEGAALLPESIVQHGIDSRNYICVVPTKEFQYEHYKKREWVKEYLKTCSNPDLAFTNWMERDAMFAQNAIQIAQLNNLSYLIVDGIRCIAENYSFIKEKLHV